MVTPREVDYTLFECRRICILLILRLSQIHFDVMFVAIVNHEHKSIGLFPAVDHHALDITAGAIVAKGNVIEGLTIAVVNFERPPV